MAPHLSFLAAAAALLSASPALATEPGRFTAAPNNLAVQQVERGALAEQEESTDRATPEDVARPGTATAVQPKKEESDVMHALQVTGKRYRLKDRNPLKVSVDTSTHVGVSGGAGNASSKTTSASYHTSSNGTQAASPSNLGTPVEAGMAPPRTTTCTALDHENLASPEDISGYPCFPEGTKSLLSKTLSPEVWDSLHDAVDRYGYSFKQAIFSGTRFTNSGVGVYVGGHLGYYQFAALYDKIIQAYHGHGPTDEHISDMDASKLTCPDFPEDEAAMINSVRIRVARNLEDYALGTAVTREQRKAIEAKVTSALSEFDGDLKGTYYPLGEMSDEDRKTLTQDHFLFKGGDQYLQVAGLERDWPEARGIFHNDQKTFLVWVNEEDQLRIISMQNGANIREVFERLARAAALIEQKAKFANDKHLGYITSCPTNLGTGMRASVHIKLPNLGKNMDAFEKIAAEYHVQIRGAHGEHTSTDDGLFDISNKRRLGFSEVQLVQDMYNGVKAMIEKEKELAGGGSLQEEVAEDQDEEGRKEEEDSEGKAAEKEGQDKKDDKKDESS